MENRQQPPIYTFQDDPSVRELFADEVHTISVQGSVLRIVLTANRPDKPASAGVSECGSKIVVGRIVLPLPAIVSIHDHLGQIREHLEQRAILVRGATEGGAQ